jgi:hypothetical protein
MCLANIIMVFHRILDFKMGWISILALFLFYAHHAHNYYSFFRISNLNFAK